MWTPPTEKPNHFFDHLEAISLQEQEWEAARNEPEKPSLPPTYQTQVENLTLNLEWIDWGLQEYEKNKQQNNPKYLELLWERNDTWNKLQTAKDNLRGTILH